jgi:hypothetical protein
VHVESQDEVGGRKILGEFFGRKKTIVRLPTVQKSRLLFLVAAVCPGALNGVSDARLGEISPLGKIGPNLP